MFDPILVILVLAAIISTVLAVIFSRPKKQKRKRPESIIEPVRSEPLTPINEEIFDVYPYPPPIFERPEDEFEESLIDDEFEESNEDAFEELPVNEQSEDELKESIVVDEIEQPSEEVKIEIEQPQAEIQKNENFDFEEVKRTQDPSPVYETPSYDPPSYDSGSGGDYGGSDD